MKLKRLITALALAVGFTTAATAAIPVAVWDGDFKTETKGDYSFAANGNTVALDGSYIEIAANVGVLLNWPAPTTPNDFNANGNITILVKYSNWTAGKSNGALATLWAGGNGTNNKDIVGPFTTASTGVLNNIWNGTADGRGSKQDLTPAASGKFSFDFSGDAAPKGSTTYLCGSSETAFAQACTGNGTLFTTTKNIYSAAIGGSRNASNNLAAQTGMRIEAIAIFNTRLTAVELAAYRFPSEQLTTHEATVEAGGPWDWTDLEWNPEITDPASSKLELTIQATDAYFTMDEDPNCYSLDVTGTMKIKVDAEGEDIAKKTAVGAPYADWLFKTTATVTGTFEPVFNSALPNGYTASYEIVAGQGVRYVVTAPASAKFGSVNLNLHNGTALSGDGNHGLYPAALADWGNLKVANDGTVTQDGLTFTLSSSVSGYGVNGTPPDMIQKQYMDDNNNGVTRTITVSGMAAKGYEQYRAIVYFSTDAADISFAPLSVTVGGDTTWYAGPMAGSTTVSCTVKGSENVWGHTGPSHNANSLGEGVNALVTDVMTADSITLNFLKKDGQRATPAAIQVVKVGEAITTTVDYKATIEEEGEWDLSALDWDTKPFEPTNKDTVTITVADGVAATVNVDMEDLAVSTFVTAVGNGAALTLTGNAFTANVIDDSASTGATTIDIDPGTMPIKAGADTILNTLGTGKLTIADGKKLTITGGTITPSQIANAGTLNFKGGSASDPICIDGGVAAGLGTIMLAEDTYVKQDDKGTGTKYDVTGSGASSFFTVARNGTGSPGMVAGSRFENVIVGSAATPDGNNFWLEHATIADTVGLNLTGNLKLSDLTPNPVVIRSLTGTYNLANNNGNPSLTICCTEDADFAGTSGIPITIGEGEGTQTFSGAFTRALTVNAGGKVKLTGAANPSSISGAGSVTIASVAGTATNTSDVANFTGAITVDASVTTLVLGTSRPTCDFVFAGSTVVQYTENVSDDGEVYQLNVTSGTEPTYKVIGIDGIEKEIEGGKYAPSVTGKAALYAWEFNGNLDSVGQDTGTMGNDNGPFYKDGTEVFALTQPYKNLTWPTEFTVAIHATLPDLENACLVAWGTLTGGGIGLTTGDPTKNEVKMVYWPNDTAYTPLATMKVPNAQTSKHLYVFTKTADTLKIYLDGSLVVDYNGAYSLGGGLQVGSVHGGIGDTNLGRLDVVYKTKTDTDACSAVINSMRIYNTVLGPNAMAELVKEFPYVSPNGTFTRALTGTENQWVAEGAWTKVGEADPYAAPDAGSTVNLSAAADATVTLNLEASVDYEALNLTGDGAITIAAAANVNKISSSGTVKIGSDATIQYSAMSLAGTAIEVAAGKTLVVDCSMIDLSQYYATTTISLTGLVTGDGEFGFEVPEAITGRSAEAQFNESNNTWELVITVDDHPFVYNKGWTWNEQPVAAVAVSNNTANAIVVQSDLEWNIDRSTFTVDAGTLKATQPGTATITVNGGAFDVNGLSGSLYTVILNGGSLVNNGERIGDANQITAINLTDDSTVGGLYDFSLQGNASSGQYGTTSMDLGEYTLTKTGTNSFALVNTTIDGTGTLYVEEGVVNSSEDTVFSDGVLKIGANGTFRQRADGKTLTIAKIVGEGGLFDQRGTVSDFTLTGTLTLANAGTFGTITLDDATLNVGGKRGLALEGSGTVKAVLTQAEMMAAEPLTLFTTTEGDFTVWLTDYNGRDLEAGTDYTIEGGVVTPTAIPFIYSDGWTWNGDEVEASAVAAATAGAIIVEAGTCEWNIDRDITVDGGTLKATGTAKANAAITVNEEGTFDVNGRENTEWTVLLKGGSLVNNGTAIGNTKKQINLLTVEDYDSTVDASANFGLIKAGYNPTTLGLGGKKLTKTGAAMFWLCNATVANGTFEVAEGTLQVTGENNTRVTTFADDASLVLGKGTTLAVARPLTIGAITANGATINNTSTITPFTLTGSAALTGNGTWGTITLDTKIMNPAVLNVGTIHGLAIAGDGTVNAVLTAAEIAQEGPITVFTTESEYVVGGTVKDANGNPVPGTFTGGSFQVDHEAKIGTTYYLTLNQALEAVQENDKVELLTAAAIDADKEFATTFTLDLNGQQLTATTATIAAGTLTLTNCMCKAPAKTGSSGGFAPNGIITVADGATLNLSGLPFGTTYGGIEGTGSLALASGATAKFYKWNYPMVDSANWMFYNYKAFFTGSTIPPGAYVWIGDTMWTGGDGRFVIDGEVATGTVTANHNIGGDYSAFDHIESFASLATAVSAVKADTTVTLTDDTSSADIAQLDKSIQLDLNGKSFTVASDSAFTVNADLEVVNGVEGQGGLVMNGNIVANAEVDIYSLPVAAGGLVPKQGGSLTIKADGVVKFPSAWANKTANMLEANTPGFLTGTEDGATIITGQEYVYSSGIGCWKVDGAVAKAITTNAKTLQPMPETYATLDEAIAAANVDTTVTLIDNITTTAAQQWNIAKNITIDFADKTITKTVANDWVFTVADGADVTFDGTTGGIVHYPAVLNQDNPASMIQIIGKLTVNGGVYESDFTVFKTDDVGTKASELIVNDGTFTIAPRPGTAYTGPTYAVMNWCTATIKGGAFNGNVVARSYQSQVYPSVVTIDGGTFNADVAFSQYGKNDTTAGTIKVADGLSVVPTIMKAVSGNEVKSSIETGYTVYTLGAAMPKATVVENPIVAAYGALDAAYTFTADGTCPAQPVASKNVDYVVTFDKDVEAGAIRLAAVMESGWTNFPAMKFTAGTPYPLIASMEKTVSVAEMYAMGSFTCGISNINVTTETKMTVQLVMADTVPYVITNVTYTLKATVKPTPYEPIPAADPVAKAAEINAGGTDAKKAVMAPPEGATVTDTYYTYFSAVPAGDAAVAMVLNEAGTNAVTNAVFVVETNALAVALSVESTLTIAEPLAGFYYSLKQGGDVKNLGYNAAGDKNKLGGKDDISFMLIKKEDASFYQTIITPTPYEGEQ